MENRCYLKRCNNGPMVWWLAHWFFTAAIRVRIPDRAVKFGVADLYVKVPSGSNRLFLCPLDVLYVLYCHQPVPCVLVTSCYVARLRVELRCVRVVALS